MAKTDSTVSKGVLIKFPVEQLERLDEVVAESPDNRSEWVRKAVEARLVTHAASGPLPKEDRRARKRSGEAASPCCSHRNKTVHSWGTICGDCGTRIR